MADLVIVVEDGTGIVGANSYMSADDVRTYALNRGITLPAIVNDVDPIIPFMVLAMDYLEGLSYIYYPATTTQGLTWPRKPFFWSDPSCWLMPTKIGSAQAQLVIEQAENDIDLFASMAGFNQGGGFVTRRKVDVIETQYSDRVIPGQPDLPALTNLLRGLQSFGNGLRTVRV